jgi:hypothetical protein
MKTEELLQRAREEETSVSPFSPPVQSGPTVSAYLWAILALFTGGFLVVLIAAAILIIQILSGCS